MAFLAEGTIVVAVVVVPWPLRAVDGDAAAAGGAPGRVVAADGVLVVVVDGAAALGAEDAGPGVACGNGTAMGDPPVVPPCGEEGMP